jgi:hypothetical protein
MLARAEDIGKIVHELGTCGMPQAMKRCGK